jgi:putative transposase
LSPKCYLEKDETESNEEDTIWKERIEAILIDFPYYGSVRVTKELHRRKYSVNKKRIARIMKESGLAQKRRRSWTKTTNSRHLLPTYPNLVKDIATDHPKHIWVADITYVRLAKGFCYVAIVLDVFTKKVVGWSVELHMETSLVVDALKLALCGGAPEYHHSDRGGQYCSYEYTNLLKENRVKISMADTGVSVDNAYAESFNRTLKVEEVYLADYETIVDAKASLKKFIEVLYNKKRLHSSLGYKPPEEFEEEWLKENENRDSM